MNTIFSIIRRLYMVTVAAVMCMGVAFAIFSKTDTALALFNALVTIPIGAYVLLRITRYVSQGQ
jgi:hypothetical protein